MAEDAQKERGPDNGRREEPEEEFKGVVDLANRCMDRPGYVVMFGILSNDGKRVEYHFRRYHMHDDDVKQTIEEFIRQYQNGFKKVDL